MKTAEEIFESLKTKFSEAVISVTTDKPAEAFIEIARI